MKITRVETIPFSVPMLHVAKIATGSFPTLDHVLVRIHTDEGLVGQAEAPARAMIYGESVTSIVCAVRDWFAPALVGTDPFAVERIWLHLDAVMHNATAKAAIDMALHDIIGQAAGVPLWRLFGGWGNEVILSHLLNLGPPEEVADQALQMIAEHGFRWFKIYVGLDPKRDVAAVRAVREAVGPDVRLSVDCNHSYSALVAARALPEFELYDIAWVEEPCPAWDEDGRALVARSTRLPLMADESRTTPLDVLAEIRHGHCRLVSIKNARTGYTQSAKILHLCELNSVATVVGTQGDSDIGSLSSAHFAAAHKATAERPAELGFFIKIADHMLIDPPQIRNGTLTLSDAPGIGLQIDEEKLARYRME